jgi:hypothetical protein
MLECLQEIGVQIEEPFGILALEVFCDNICKNIKQAQAAAGPLREAAQGHPAGAVQVPLPVPLPPAAASISTVAGYSFEGQQQPSVMLGAAAARSSGRSSCAPGQHDLQLYVGSTVAAPDNEEEGFTI